MPCYGKRTFNRKKHCGGTYFLLRSQEMKFGIAAGHVLPHPVKMGEMEGPFLVGRSPEFNGVTGFAVDATLHLQYTTEPPCGII